MRFVPNLCDPPLGVHTPVQWWLSWWVKKSSSYFPSDGTELEWELPCLGMKDSSLPNHRLPSTLKAQNRHLYERFCCLSMFSQQQLTLIMQTMQHRWSKHPSHHTCQFCFTWEFLLRTQNHHPFPSPQLSSQKRKRCMPRSIRPCTSST